MKKMDISLLMVAILGLFLAVTIPSVYAVAESCHSGSATPCPPVCLEGEILVGNECKDDPNTSWLEVTLIMDDQHFTGEGGEIFVNGTELKLGEEFETGAPQNWRRIAEPILVDNDKSNLITFKADHHFTWLQGHGQAYCPNEAFKIIKDIRCFVYLTHAKALMFPHLEIIGGTANSTDFTLSVDGVEQRWDHDWAFLQGSLKNFTDTHPDEYILEISNYDHPDWGELGCDLNDLGEQTLEVFYLCTYTYTYFPDCIGDQVPVDGVCVDPCPEGEERDNNGICKPNECPTGYELDGDTCFPIECPDGLMLDGNDCIPIDCPEGQIWSGEVCIPCAPTCESPAKSKDGGDEAWDTRPTFGVNHETRETRMVDDGFIFNRNSFTITDNHHTDFEEQPIQIGTRNTFAATVWATSGLKVQEFLFGIPSVGMGHQAEMRVEVWHNSAGEIDTVKVVQDTEVIDVESLSVTHQKAKCLSTSIDKECDRVSMSAVFLEPLKDNIMAIKAIDFDRRAQTTYLNDGFDISGDSLNEMETRLIPSPLKGEGLVEITQNEKYSTYWSTEDGRIFERNSFDSFKHINPSFERFQDTGEPLTRLHSDFGKMVEYEKARAVEIFDASKLIAILPDSFSHDIIRSDRVTPEVIEMMKYEELRAMK